MRSSFLHVLSGLVLASVVVMAGGCNQDTLNSGSQNINMAYTPSPSGAGRFDRASFFFNRIQALPADPAEAALYGTERILFQFDPFKAELTLTAPVTFSNISLSTGAYNVTLIEFTPPALVDTDLAPPPYASCIDGIATIDAQSVKPPYGPVVPATFLFRIPQDNLSGMSFALSPGQTNLALNVNVPGLIQGYQDSFTCQYVPCPGCPVNPKPTLTAFNNATFKAALLANITIE